MAVDLIENIGFAHLTPTGLDAYVREKAAEHGLTIADAYFASVCHTLSDLQIHASVLAAGVDDVEPPPTRMASS